MDFKIILILFLMFLLVIATSLLLFFHVTTNSYIFLRIFIPITVTDIYFIAVLLLMRYENKENCYNIPCLKKNNNEYEPFINIANPEINNNAEQEEEEYNNIIEVNTAIPTTYYYN